MIRNVLCVVGIACAVMCAQPVSAAPDVPPVQSQSVQTYCGPDEREGQKNMLWFDSLGRLMEQKVSTERKAYSFTGWIVVDDLSDPSASFVLSPTQTLELTDSDAHVVIDTFVDSGHVFDRVWGEYQLTFYSHRCDPMSTRIKRYRYWFPFIAIDMDANTVMAR